MSTISSLIDELRKSADEWNGSNMFELARMCSDAADTILELNVRLTHMELHECPGCQNVADLQEALDENARLRSCLSDDGDNARQIMGENAWLLTQLEDVIESMGRVEERCAKLRELVRDYDYCVMHSDCSRCKYDGKPSTHCPLSPCFPDTGELYELGIEVDDGTE